MVDFIENYYYNKSDNLNDGYDKEQAKKKAFSAILPIIMEKELTKRQSVCLRYKYINNKSQSEIANILKLSQPTVSRHISTAKDIVNNKLKYCYLALAKGLDEYDKLNS